MNQIVASISDKLLHQEYVKRFTLKAGEELCDSSVVYRHLRAYFTRNLDREKLVVVYLNGRNAHIGTEVIFEGTLTTSAVYPRELVKKVLKYGAAAIILAHNHPSGSKEASEDDIALTKKIKFLCDLIDVQVHDHLILYGSGFTSFVSKGLL